MVKKIIGVVVAVLVLFSAYVISRPSDFRIERAATINAPVSLVFPHIADLHAWSDWSPWAKLDPDMHTLYGGPDYGVGSTYSWIGDDKVGEGRMTVMELRPLESVQIKLDFIKPFQATNTSNLSVKVPHGDVTLITWEMEGQNNFLAKAFSVFVDVDTLVGQDFERGLGTLKGMCEAEAQKAATLKDTAPTTAPAALPTGAEPAANPAH